MAERIAISARALLEVVEAGTGANAAARASAMLAAGLPGVPEDQRQSLTLGERDAWLLELRWADLFERLARRLVEPGAYVILPATPSRFEPPPESLDPGVPGVAAPPSGDARRPASEPSSPPRRPSPAPGPARARGPR